MAAPCLSAGARLGARCVSGHPRLARVVVAGLTALTLLGAAGAPALAYSADPTVVVATPAPASAPLAGVADAVVHELGGGDLEGQAGSAPAASASSPAMIKAPFMTQLDGSVWAQTNCGPASLAMALGAFNVQVDPVWVRRLANVQMGSSDPNEGTSWESLAATAQLYNLTPRGLYSTGHTYRNWTIDDLKSELSQGHPVLLLTHYNDLPDHTPTSFAGDHYVLALGFDAKGNLVFDDPANSPANGTATMTPAQLNQAWSNTTSGLARTAMAISK